MALQLKQQQFESSSNDSLASFILTNVTCMVHRRLLCCCQKPKGKSSRDEEMMKRD